MSVQLLHFGGCTLSVECSISPKEVDVQSTTLEPRLSSDSHLLHLRNQDLSLLFAHCPEQVLHCS